MALQVEQADLGNFWGLSPGLKGLHLEGICHRDLPHCTGHCNDKDSPLELVTV